MPITIKLKLIMLNKKLMNKKMLMLLFKIKLEFLLLDLNLCKVKLIISINKNQIY